MSNINERKIIQMMLSELAEKDLFDPIHDIFLSKGYQAWVTHDSTELGKDLVATQPGAHNYIISVKKGKIDKHRWDSEVEPHLKQLMQTRIGLNGVDESLPRKPLLIVNGNLTIPVSRMLQEFNRYYAKHDENPVEVWELEKLTSELHAHILGLALINKKHSEKYFEDIQRLILSIRGEEFNRNELDEFVKEYSKFNNFSIFKISFVYVLRRCESVMNFYAFFHFAEYSLLVLWKSMYHANDFSLIEKFDEIHQVYLEGLEDWCKSADAFVSKDHGFYESEAGFSEFIEYPLRIFDALRRFSYLACYSYKHNSEDKLKSISKQIINLIKSNYEACTSPLCEFNYNDIAVTLAALFLMGNTDLARKWIIDLTDFLIIQSLTGHRILPLGHKIDGIGNFIISQPFTKIDSHILLLLLEFSSILGFQSIYDLLKPHVGNRLFLMVKSMPRNEYEGEIYDKDVINSEIVRISALQPTWESFRDWFTHFTSQSQRNYSPLVYQRDLLLILISNVYRDRYFPDVWRSLINQNQTGK